MSTLHWTTYDSPLGTMLLAATPEALAGAWFDGQRHFAGRDPAAPAGDDLPVLRETTRQLRAYFTGRLHAFDLPLAARGTSFQHAVWRAIGQVPYGGTLDYSALAAAVGAPGAARAAGAATGRNPWSIIVPCHRIVGARGELTGYAGGLARKRALLALEAGAAQPRAA